LCTSFSSPVTKVVGVFTLRFRAPLEVLYFSLYG
jgi:hypothetical protein